MKVVEPLVYFTYLFSIEIVITRAKVVGILIIFQKKKIFVVLSIKRRHLLCQVPAHIIMIEYNTITYKPRLTQKKNCTKKPMLFLASMGKTGLCHDIVFIFSLRPFQVECQSASKFWGCDLEIWQTFLKVWLHTSKR